MELKLVYRFLRKLSQWVADNYYSQVLVDGVSHVPRTGPLILASTHHNQTVDIMLLTATVPHGRPICYWAKSSLFKGFPVRQIMESTGAIPVKRNPNKGLDSQTAPTSTSQTDANGGGETTDGEETGNNTSTNAQQSSTFNSQGNLFKSTTHALKRGDVIGIFPEGTSYTLPSIAQVFPGAARAAAEYVRTVGSERLAGLGEREREVEMQLAGRGLAQPAHTGLKIVPVGIVYTDKAKYMSRVHVNYGEPINVDDYTSELFDTRIDANEATKSVVTKLNTELEKRLFALTVNAPDWETIYASRTALRLLWTDEDSVNLQKWVEVSQTLIHMLTPSSKPNPKLDHLRKSLVRYYALLYYCNVSHAILEDIYPVASTTESDVLSFSSILNISQRLLITLPLTLLQFISFIPPFLFHIPAYLTSHLAMKYLYVPGEEETQADYRSIGGGLGLIVGTMLIVVFLWWNGTLKWVGLDFLAAEHRSLKRLLDLVAVVCTLAYLLVNWHSLYIKGQLRELDRLVTFGKFVQGAWTTPDLGRDQLEIYSKPPVPPKNVFVKRNVANSAADTTASSSGFHERPPPIAARKLIHELLKARLQAYINLGNYLRNKEGKEILVLLGHGAVIPSPIP